MKATVPIRFPCCGVVATGLRGAHVVGNEIWRYAQCPKCARRHNLKPVPGWGPKEGKKHG